jgi:hypothetical protein
MRHDQRQLEGFRDKLIELRLRFDHRLVNLGRFSESFDAYVNRSLEMILNADGPFY